MDKIKSILITGSGGFAGANLKDYFAAKGHKITAPRSRDFDFEDSAAVAALFKNNHFDAVIHCGFYGISDLANLPADLLPRNMQIFNNLAKNLPPNAVMLNFGSGAEYDKSRNIINAQEGSALISTPSDAYGKAKQAIARETEKYPNIFNLRIFGLYGKGEAQRRFISYAIRQNMAKQAINMRQNVRFSYLYIDDFCRIIQAFINKAPKAKHINLTPTQSIEILEAAQIVNQIGKFQSPINIEQSGMANEYTGSNKTLLQELPSLQFTSYQDGISKLYAIIAGGKNGF